MLLSRSDNAGCYKSQVLLLALWYLRFEGLPIHAYIFSESGSGKYDLEFYKLLDWKL